MGKSSAGKKSKPLVQSVSRVLRSRKIGFDETFVVGDSNEGDEVNFKPTGAKSKPRDDGNSETNTEASSVGIQDTNPMEGMVPGMHGKDDDLDIIQDTNPTDDERDDYPPLLKSNDLGNVGGAALNGGSPSFVETNVVKSKPADISSAPQTYSKVLTSDREFQKVDFRYVEPVANQEDGIDVEIPLESVLEAAKRYNHTLYGYFLGNRVAFLVVKTYVTNVWKKFGLENVMMNAKGFFFFKFASDASMRGVLENGPWIVRNIPIIHNTWSPEVEYSGLG